MSSPVLLNSYLSCHFILIPVEVRIHYQVNKPIELINLLVTNIENFMTEFSGTKT